MMRRFTLTCIQINRQKHQLYKM
uniref:Cation transport protein chaC n=1 Tax=Arundo donax TaxID=35708 RepID=A0A0A9H910_ARUDO